MEDNVENVENQETENEEQVSIEIKGIEMEYEEIITRTQTVFGIPKVMFDSNDIVSPVFVSKAKKYVEKRLNEIEEIEEADQEMVKIAFIYYLCYLIAPTMYTRLPQKMENISTKTTMFNIDWYKFAEEMLKNCEDILEDLLEEYGIELVYGTTAVDLSDEAPYPNELV